MCILVLTSLCVEIVESGSLGLAVSVGFVYGYWIFVTF